MLLLVCWDCVLFRETTLVNAYINIQEFVKLLNSIRKKRRKSFYLVIKYKNLLHFVVTLVKCMLFRHYIATIILLLLQEMILLFQKRSNVK